MKKGWIAAVALLAVALMAAWMLRGPAPARIKADAGENEPVRADHAASGAPGGGAGKAAPKVAAEANEAAPAVAPGGLIPVPMEIPTHLPKLKVQVQGQDVEVAEIEDVEVRRHVYGQAAPQAIGCIGAAGVKLDALDPKFRARIVLTPTAEGGTEVTDIVMLDTDSAPPELVRCLKESLGKVQLSLGRGVQGVVTTPPFAGERPKAADKPADKP